MDFRMGDRDKDVLGWKTQRKELKVFSKKGFQKGNFKRKSKVCLVFVMKPKFRKGFWDGDFGIDILRSKKDYMKGVIPARILG